MIQSVILSEAEGSMLKNISEPWYSKGNIATGTLFLVGLMLFIGYVGVQLTSGLVPTQIPENIGTVVTPKLETRESGKNNLQMKTFGFITPVPTQQSASSSAIAN